MPFAPGGAVDVVGRILATAMGEQLGQTVVVENKAGASGNIGAQQVRRAKADGISLEDIEVEDPSSSVRREAYALYLWEKRQRKGLSLGEAQRRLFNGNYFGSMMVARGAADAVRRGAAPPVLVG